MNWEVIKQIYKQTKAVENIKQSGFFFLLLFFFFTEEWLLAS